MKKVYFTLISTLLIVNSCYTQWSSLGTGVTASPRSIWSISVVDEDIVWAFARHTTNSTPTFELTRTIDGGISWHPVLMNGIDALYHLINIFALDDVTAWAAVADELNPISGRVYKTTDGGNNWVEQSTGFTGFNETPAAVHFWNANEGVAFGATGFLNYNDQIAIYTTADGGENWIKVLAPNMPTQLTGEGMWVYSGNSFFDVVGDHVWFITNGSRIYHSADKGITWETQETGITTGNVSSIAFQNETNGLAITYDPAIVRTTNGGATWQTLTPPSEGFYFTDMEYVPGTEATYIVHDAYFANDTRMYITYDAGNNWETMETGESFWTLQFFGPKIGFGGGDLTNPNEGGMYKWAGKSLSGRIYVNDNAIGANTGYNWNDAFSSLSDALAEAQEGDEVWVATGHYKPDTINGNRNATFLIDKNLTLFGGFAGTETNADDRNPDTNPTILSGDLNGDDIEDDFESNRNDNVMTIVTIDNSITNATLIDGFTIRNGHANGTQGFFGNGGGLIIIGAPIIRNCTITQNFAKNLGGGLFLNLNGGSPTSAIFERCTFDSNLSNRGGAVDIKFRDVHFNDCFFTNNLAIATLGQPFEQNGGAINTQNANCHFNNCTFTANVARGGGGGVFFWVDWDGEDYNLEMDSCIFSNNSAPIGGALYSLTFGKNTTVNLHNSNFNNNSTKAFGNVSIYHWAEDAYGTVLIDNCSFEDNTSATYSAGLDIGSGTGAAAADYTITNCVFKNNAAELIGGALGLWAEVGTDANFVIENCLFENNQAGDEAGAMWIFNGSDEFTASIKQCKFIENQSPTGAAIGSNNDDLITQFEPTQANLELVNCLVNNNTGDNVVSIFNFPDFKILNSTIAGNTGEAIELANQSGLTLQNTILYNPGNFEFSIPNGEVCVSSKGGNLIGDASFASFALAEDLQSTNPLFVSANDYHLSDNSPAIDTGVDTGDLPEFDLDGNNRLNGCVDIGAYESAITVSAECVTDTRELILDNTLFFSPNPAGSFLTIRLADDVGQVIEVSIFDMQGKLIGTQSISSGQSIDVQHLAKGMYLLEVLQAKNIYMGRFVKG